MPLGLAFGYAMVILFFSLSLLTTRDFTRTPPTYVGIHTCMWVQLLSPKLEDNTILGHLLAIIEKKTGKVLVNCTIGSKHLTPLRPFCGIVPSFFGIGSIYFAGIRFAGFSVFRSVSFPPFSYSSPLSPPLFSKRGLELLKKGAIAPLLRKKGGNAPFLIPKCTNQVFLRYGIGNTGEIPNEY